MADDVEALLESGRAALDSGDWASARAAFLAVLERQGDVADAHFGLAEAEWWLGDIDASIRSRERSFAAYRRQPEPMRAALAAIVLCFDYRKQVGNPVAAAGWLARATRLIEEHDIRELRGWLLFTRSFASDDLEAAERWAGEARQVGHEMGDADLELCAIGQVGAVLVRQGRVAEGVRWLDEAMAGSLGGEGGSPGTVVFTSCMMITSCTDCAEFERAVHWVRETQRFTERYGCPFLYAECRIVFGEVLLATGDWVQAEAELSAVLDASPRTVPSLHRRAAAALAELRLAQGRVEDAGRLVAGLGDHPETAPVVAKLHLAHGRPAAAAAVLERRLNVIDGLRLDGAVLVELLGQVDLAGDDPAQAAARGAQLVELGASFGCDIIRARGERLVGRANAARGDVGQARRHLDAALVALARLGLRYEAARTRMLLAEALRTAEPEVAEAEARAGLAVFDELGAGPDADAAASFLRELGVRAARPGLRDADGLTRREHEVLRLLGDGLSNPEIAARLYVSRKTVEHHVASVLAKLGVDNRHEAARHLSK